MLHLSLIIFRSVMMLVSEVVTYVVKIFIQFLSSKGDIINWNFGFKSRYEIPHQGMLNF